MSDPREPLTDAEREKAIGGGSKPNYEDDGMRTWTCGCYEDQGGYHFCGKNHTMTPDPLVAPVVGCTPEDVCLRCGRVPSDLIHDNPNDHGWTGTSAMHPFVDERGKWLLQWTARNVSLYSKSGQKGRHLTNDEVKWNEAIGKAESAVAEMFAPLTSESLARHDRYFADEYVKRAALVPRPEPREPEPPLKLRSATESVGWVNSVGPLAVSPTFEKFDAAVRPASAPSLEQVIAQKDAAYAERDQLVAALSKLWPSHLARHPDEDVTWENDWRWIVCIHSPVGQLSWHIHDSEREQFDHLDALRGDWDGHTTEEKYARLKSLAASAPSRPLEELIELIEDLQCGSFAERHRPHALDNETCLAIADRLRVLVPGGDPQEP